MTDKTLTRSSEKRELRTATVKPSLTVAPERLANYALVQAGLVYGKSL